MEKVICRVCETSYTDKESIDQVKRWITEGYAPCPNISCPGEFEVKEA